MRLRLYLIAVKLFSFVYQRSHVFKFIKFVFHSNLNYNKINCSLHSMIRWWMYTVHVRFYSPFFQVEQGEEGGLLAFGMCVLQYFQLYLQFMKIWLFERSTDIHWAFTLTSYSLYLVFDSPVYCCCCCFDDDLRNWLTLVAAIH